MGRVPTPLDEQLISYVRSTGDTRAETPQSLEVKGRFLSNVSRRSTKGVAGRVFFCNCLPSRVYKSVRERGIDSLAAPPLLLVRRLLRCTKNSIEPPFWLSRRCDTCPSRRATVIQNTHTIQYRTPGSAQYIHISRRAGPSQYGMYVQYTHVRKVHYVQYISRRMRSHLPQRSRHAALPCNCSRT